MDMMANKKIKAINSQLLDIAINVKQFGAKGDGITNDITAFQNAINYVYSYGGGTVICPPTSNGYYIDGTIIYKDNVKLIGTNTKIKFNPSTTIKECISNTIDNLKYVYIDGFDFETEQIYTQTSGEVTYYDSNLQLIHLKNAKKVILNNITSDSFNYTFKSDGDGIIEELITTNIIGKNCIMFFHLAGINKWIANNLDSTLLNTTVFNHHYYLKKILTNLYLDNIKCTNGNGYGLHFYDTGYVDKIDNINISNTYFNNVFPVLLGRNIGIINFKDVVVNGCASNVFTTSASIDNLNIDEIKLINAKSLLDNTSTLTKVNVKNVHYIGKQIAPTTFKNIDNLIIDNVYFDDAGWVNNNSYIALNFAGTFKQVYIKNIIINLPTTISSNDLIRMGAIGTFYLDNIQVIGDSSNDTVGFFIWMNGSMSRVINLSNINCSTMSSFIIGTDALATVRVTNCIHKGNNVGTKSSTATIASSSSSIVVNHNLYNTPLINNIKVTPTNNLGSSTKFWISNITSTQFTINVDVAPGASTATFVWQANL